jgi:Fe-S-cluster-containing hydrogenase component 2
MACELACSFVKAGAYSPALSRIKIVQVPALGVNVPIVCINCAEAPCIASCPSEAIVRQEGSGVVLILEEHCTTCGECVEACPYGAVHIPSGGDLALMCDLCGGRPVCVDQCLYGALRYDGRADMTYGSLTLDGASQGLEAKRHGLARAVARRLADAQGVQA